MKYFIIIVGLLCCSQMLSGQTKNEKEARIDLKAFPDKARAVVNSLPEKCKRLRHYKEKDGDKNSFESKFKYKGEHYSLEFNPDGIIEDIEVIIKFKKLEDTPRNAIETYFKTAYKKYDLIKIQKQYVFDAVKDPLVFLNEVLSKRSSATVNYEIISEVTTKSERNIREFSFNSNGNFLRFKVLDPDSYEHALY